MFNYQRHQPEDTLLFKIIKKYYPIFENHLKEQGRVLPKYVQNEFEDYLKWGLLEYGFLRVCYSSCHHEKLLAFSCKRRGFCPSCGVRRMVDSAALLIDTICHDCRCDSGCLVSLFTCDIVCKTTAHYEQGACDFLSHNINISYKKSWLFT